MNTMLVVLLIMVMLKLVNGLVSVCGTRLIRPVIAQELIGLTRWQERRKTQDVGCSTMNRAIVTRV
jgi:hypothetical protein